jgi:hypothetical protein
MAMRAPQADPQSVPPDADPVLRAIRNAPIVDGDETEEEREAIRAWEEAGRPFIDGAIVSAEIAERARREG